LMPIAPFITTTFPEISRSVPLRQWQQLRRLLKRTTLIAAAWTGACAIGVLALGRPLLSLLKHGEYLPSYPAILILLVGYGIANILFWNRPLLLAFGNSRYPLRVNFFTGVVKTGLMFMLVPPFGYLVQAAILSGYLAVSVAVIVGRGLVELRQAEKVELAGEAV
jgi:O-antigen/teichoic acid export membrane protein